MTKPGRIPCINPRCKRTAPADKYEPGTEIICRKCFKALPAELRDEYSRCRNEIGKWERRVTRTSDEIKIKRMHDIVDKWVLKADFNWRKIREHIIEPERPAGIENFLSEMGLKD